VPHHSITVPRAAGYSRRGHTRQGMAGFGRAWHTRQRPVATLGKQGKACHYAQSSPYAIQRTVMAMLVHGPSKLQGRLRKGRAGQGLAGQRQ